jgi:hypothetical protein
MPEETTIPSFNPSGNDHVANIKLMTEELLRYVDEHCPDPRTKALAKTNYEQAAMWAVKSFFMKAGERA